MKGFWDRVDANGVDRNPYRAGFLQFVGVSETDEQAERDYAAAADYFYNRCLHVAPGFADAPGYRTMKTVKAGLMSQVGGSPRRSCVRDSRGRTSSTRATSSPAARPDVRQQLEDVAKGLNVGHLMLLLHFGNLPRETVTKNTELFAREVMPQLRDLFGE